MSQFLKVFCVLTLILVLCRVVFSPDNNLHVVACDVGQGDAFLLEYGSIQILIDGGKNNQVLECLGKFMPFWDKNLELVMMTHADADHYVGLVEVVKRYRVERMVGQAFEPDTPELIELSRAIEKRGIKFQPWLWPTKMRWGNLRMSLLWPRIQDVDEANKNANSLVSLVEFGHTKVLFTGDITAETEKKLLTDSNLGQVDILKVAHHGSKTSTSEAFLTRLKPGAALISVGRKNPYRHPDQAVLARLEQFGVKVLRTDQLGSFEVISDGDAVWVKTGEGKLKGK